MTSTSLLPERVTAPVQPTARRRPLGALVVAVAILLGTPAAVQASYAEREDARAFAAEIAGRHALDAAEVERALAGARHDPEVIRLITPPARKGVRSWRSYRARFLDRQERAEYEATLAAQKDRRRKLVSAWEISQREIPARPNTQEVRRPEPGRARRDLKPGWTRN